MATLKQINRHKLKHHPEEEIKKAKAANKETLRLSKQARVSDFSLEKLETLIKEHESRVRRRREFEAPMIAAELSLKEKLKPLNHQDEINKLNHQKEMLRQQSSIDQMENSISLVNRRLNDSKSLFDRNYYALQNHKPKLFFSLRDTVELDGVKYFHSALPFHKIVKEAQQEVNESKKELERLKLAQEQLKDKLRAMPTPQPTPYTDEIKKLRVILTARFEDPVFILSQGVMKREFENLSIWDEKEKGLVTQEIQKKREALHKMENLRAVAAAHVGKQRDEANKIKSGLKKQLHTHKECPYCWEILNPDDAHADHIYPIAKGGLSTTKNMVYVCSKCNSRKGTMTLSKFALKYKLDREVIEMVLEELGKDF